MMLDRRSVLLAGAASLAGCASAPPPPAAPDPTADAEFRTFVERLAQRPRTARPFLLRRFDTSRLTPAGKILYDALAPGVDAEAALAQRSWGKTGAPYIVTHRNGAYRRAAELRADDRPRFSAREVNRDTNTLEADAARGVIAPDFVLDATITAVQSAQTRVAANNDESHAAIIDALARQLDALRGLRARAFADPGVWRLPGGEEFYAQTLQFQLGASIDPREAHGRALARCRELQGEADALLRAHGLTRGDVGERLRVLRQDARYHYPATDEGKAQVTAEMNARLAQVRRLLADVIEDAADAPGEVRRVPAGQEAGGAAGRRQGAVYFVDLGPVRSTWSLPSVAFHEALPGHIYQAPFEGAAGAPELQARYAFGYSEGWATYAEQLADEAGAYADDPLGRIGYLQWMLFRYGRVVADTGIHVMRWSRERAIEEMRALQGESIAFVSIEDDVTRFCVQPGAYAAQGLAALHIAELRDRTRRQARAFDQKRFHMAMLQHGPLSPPGLDQAARAAFS
jgi:uncharacterized protein (DUF885 family)